MLLKIRSVWGCCDEKLPHNAIAVEIGPNVAVCEEPEKVEWKEEFGSRVATEAAKAT